MSVHLFLAVWAVVAVVILLWAREIARHDPDAVRRIVGLFWIVGIALGWPLIAAWVLLILTFETAVFQVRRRRRNA